MPAQGPRHTVADHVTHVAVGVVRDADDRLLIAQRAAHLHQGGCWEFPGGKVEAGESIEQALRRELREELNIDVLRSRPLISLHHDYGDKSVFLDVRLVEDFAGEARGCEGQPIKWIKREELGEYDFPEANRAIVHCLQLPERYLITGNCQDLNDMLRRLRRALDKGIRLVQFRAPQLDDPTYTAWARKLTALCHAHEAVLLLNRHVGILEAVNVDGIHLNSRVLMSLRQRPASEDKWVAASVHNEAELLQAQRVGVDFAVIGAVKATASHPGREPMGWPAFADLVRQANIPCYALGGMQAGDVQRAQQLGAQGIAAIREWWLS